MAFRDSCYVAERLYTFDYMAIAELTPRQVNVVELLDRGLTNKEIAAQLGISAKTVKAHLHVLFQKLGIQRRQQLRRLPLSS